VRHEISVSLGKVLVVDDEPEVRHILRDFLGGRGYEVVLARDGLKALAAVGAEKPDLVLLDVAMPGMDGVEVLKQMATADPPVNVIMVTANADISVTSKLRALGALDYIPKPFDLDYLKLTVSVQLVVSRGR
jgi:two-component system response regulator (stage 0 sporulation protein F)